MQDGDMESSESGELREQDRFLPIANVARIMKKGIPSHERLPRMRGSVSRNVYLSLYP